jgi:hypothetical protein
MTRNYYKEDLKKLKEKILVKEDLMDTYKKNRKLVNDVKKAIEELNKPVNVPELSEVVDYPSQDIFFAIMCLEKFNQLQVVSKRQEFPSFGFKELKS